MFGKGTIQLAIGVALGVIIANLVSGFLPVKKA